MCYENVLHALESFKNAIQDDNDVSFRRSANLTIFLYLNPFLLKQYQFLHSFFVFVLYTFLTINQLN